MRSALALALCLALLVPAPARAMVGDGSTLVQERGSYGGAEVELGVAENAVDARTGSVTFQVPIEAPPGTGQMTPQLALVYSSLQRTPSWVGSGWSLTGSTIQRSLKGGVPAYDTTDTFELDGQLLVPDASVPDRYHTRRESFLRIDRVGEIWEVRSRDGHVSRYGLDTNSRITHPGGEHFAWLLRDQEDLRGNVIQYTYAEDDAGRRYLQEVRYGLRRGGGGELRSLNGSLAPDDSVDRVIAFMLEDRPDPSFSYLPGFLSELNKRLAAIDVQVGGELVRRYELVYTQSPDSATSLLAEVQEFGSDGDLDPMLRTAPRVQRFTYQSSSNPDPQLDRSGWDATDPDLDPGDPAAAAAYWQLPSAIYFTRSDHQDGGARLSDLNGDGFVDAIREVRIENASENDATSGAYLSGRWGFVNPLPPEEPPREDPTASVYRLPVSANTGRRLAFVRHRTGGGTLVEPLGVQSLDFNGDGRADVLHLLIGRRPTASGAQHYFEHEYQTRGDTGWDLVTAGYNPPGVPAGDVDEFIGDRVFGLVFHAGSVDDTAQSPGFPHVMGGLTEIAELTGDGRPDIVTQGQQDVASHTTGEITSGVFWHGMSAHQSTGDGFAPSLYGTAGYLLPCYDGEDLNECIIRTDLANNVHSGFTIGGSNLTLYAAGYDRLGKRHLDVNADGLDDRVVAKAFDDPEPGVPAETRGVYLNQGNGNDPFSDDRWLLPDGVFVDRNDNNQIPRDQGYRFVDLNGDGRVDIVRATPSARDVWLGTANPEAPWQELDPTDPWQVPAGFDFVDADGLDNGVRFADLNGDGLVDLVRSFEGESQEVTLNQGVSPDLLVAIENRFGGVTSFSYGPSTQFDNDGGDLPDLPSLVQVVTEITTDDGFGTIGSTSFSYAGGLYDAEDREFRGFAEVTATRALDGRQTITRFHQDDARAGLPESVTVLDSLGNPWHAVETTYTPDGVEPYVSLPETVTRLEYDGQATPRRSRVEHRYDGLPPSAGGDSPITLGNRTATIQLGEVDAGGADIDASDTRTTQIDYRPPNLTAYLVDRPSARRVRAGASPGSGAVLRESRFFYDGDTTGTAVPTLGELTQQVATLSVPGEPDPVTTWTYDAYGNVLTETSPRGNAGQVAAGLGTTTFEYDPVWFTFPTAVTNGLGHRAEVDIAPAPGVCAVENPPGAGLAHVERRPNDLAAGMEAVRCFDAFGRITLDRASNGIEETSWTYDDTPGAATVSRSIRATAGGGLRQSVSSLDGFGRVIETLSDGPQGGSVIETVQYDAAGRVGSQSDRQFTTETPRFATLAYDPLDRVTQVNQPGGRVSTITRAQGVTTVVDPNTNQTQSAADVFGRIVEVIEDDGSTSDKTTYAYTRIGELETVVDRGGNVFSVQYDMLGQRRQIDDPDAGITTFDRYDGDGNLEQQTTAGVVTTWAYDPLGRPLSQAAGGSTHAWTYDSAPAGLGRLATQDDASGHYEVIAYDLLGRTLSEKFVLEGKRFELQATFDPLGQRATRTLPTGRTLRWERDGRGFLTGIRTQAGAPYASGIEWEADGAPRTWTLGNGLASSTTYDPATGRVHQVRLQGGGPAVDSLVYGFDPGDRVQSITGTVGSFSFDYDTLDRLTEATGPYAEGLASATLQYAYDSLGNLTCRAATDRTNCQATGGTQLVYPTPGPGVARPHAPTQVDGLAVTYSPTGNLTGTGSRAFDYDAFERMTAARESGVVVAEFVHDAAGTLAKITDRSGPRPEVRHLFGDFEWDETRSLARTHVTLAGVRVATQSEPFTPPAEAAALPAAPLDPRWVLAATAVPAGAAALLLLLQLMWLRRLGVSLPRPALAGSTAIVFYCATVSPAWAQIADGDLNEDGRLDAADGVLILRMAGGELQPSAEEVAHGDVAPLEGTPNGVLDAGDALLILRAAGGEDVDADGLDSASELSIGASPFRRDTDGDGLSDPGEFDAFTDPTNPDTDGDGLGDAAEVLAGTDPLSADTDGDGLTDDVDPSPLEGVVYRHADRLGSSVVVTASDGSVLERTVYRPFGEAVSPTAGTPGDPPEFGFTGQRFVQPAGIYDYGARMYDPTLGRFLQPDALVPDPYAPQSLNRYAYVLNNPANRVDPSGNLSFDIGFGFGTVSFDSSLFGNGSLGFGGTLGPSVGLSFNTGTALDPGFGFSALFQGGTESPFQFGVSLPGISLPSFDFPSFGSVASASDFSSQSGQPAADPCAGGACGAHDVFDFLYALPVAGRALGAAGRAAAIRVAVPFAVRFPGTAAALGFGAPTAALQAANSAGATGSTNLAGVLGSQATANTVNAALRGREPLNALSISTRQLAGQFFRGVSTRTGGKFAEQASQFNVERARFLEGLTSRVPGGLADFMGR